jgi:hypothetical protein
VVDGQRQLGDQLAGPRGDDLGTQDLAVRSGDHLDEPEPVLVGHRSVDAVEAPARDSHLALARETLAGVSF